MTRYAALFLAALRKFSLLTSVRFLFSVGLRFSPGAAAANRRKQALKTSLLPIEGIPDGGGKPKKACNHAIVGGPP
jgi:hypothetical protein